MVSILCEHSKALIIQDVHSSLVAAMQAWKQENFRWGLCALHSARLGTHNSTMEAIIGLPPGSTHKMTGLGGNFV